MKWKKIDSAPREGRKLILIVGASGWPSVAYSNTWWVGGFSHGLAPTHWMPLPKLPQDINEVKFGGEND